MAREPEYKSPPTEQWITRTHEKGPNNYTERHPSYGVIGVSRTSGRASLFQSDTVHQHFISIRVQEARRVVDGTHQFVMADKQIAEVHMTEAQFAQFITQPNQGDGVPCTIHYSAGDTNEPWLHPRFGTRPDAPEPERFDLKFRQEAGERAQIISDNLKDLDDVLTGMADGSVKMNKGQITALKNKVRSARMQIDSNIPYVLECAGEQLEKKVSSAIVEFESYIGQSLQAKGLAHLQHQAPRLNVPTTHAPLLPAPSIDDLDGEGPGFYDPLDVESFGNDFVDGNGQTRR